MATLVETASSTSNSKGAKRRRHAKQSEKDASSSSSTNGDTKGAESMRAYVAKKYRHVAAVHSRPRTSCLDHDSDATPSFLGFRNLMVIVLVVSNFRLMIENFKKYGVLICIRCHDYRKQDIHLGIFLYFLVPCHLFGAYVIELVAAQQAKASRATRSKKSDGTATPTEDDRRKFQSAWKLIAWAHGINATACLLITSTIVYFKIHHPLIGTLSEVHAIIVWLKTASYALTNRDIRHAYLHPPKKETDVLPKIYSACPYPENITLGNLKYFWWAPTLVYQPVYPRTTRIRWLFVAKRVVEVFALAMFMWIASAQYAAPVLRNSLDKIASLDIPSMAERLMKLSTISLVIWLAGFFALFQSFLSALAEVMQFADREFYTDWWNSPSVGTYWRTWNKPVYQFMKRHIFSPLVGRGWTSQQASSAVFVLSGALHELLVGIPTHNIIGVAFLGMVAQLPLIALTAPFEKINLKHVNAKVIGNGIFWVSFTLIGQPLAAFLYFFAWQSKFGSQLPKTAMG